MNKKKLLIIGALIAGLVFAFVLFYFEPQSLFVDKKTAESQQGQIISRSSTSLPNETSDQAEVQQTEPQVPTKSQWVSREHQTSGDVFLTQDSNDDRYVRFENLATDNGPDLKVYIAKGIESNGTPIDFVDLGNLRANKGDANYLIPADVDIDEYNHVIIWCKRFSVSFADATI